MSTFGIYGGVPAIAENEEKKRNTRVPRRIYGNAEIQGGRELDLYSKLNGRAS